jgi:peptidoglycan hydrolase CwlO-like protein
MEYQNLINIAATVAIASGGWFARQVWSSVKELQADLSKLREELPKTYVTRDDFKDDIKEIKDLLMKLMDKIGEKEDRK